MDEATAKEVEDLQKRLSDVLHRKRKREDSALEKESKRLKDEKKKLENDNKELKDENRGLVCNVRNRIANIVRLEQRLTSSAKECSQANVELVKFNQITETLNADNARLKNGTRQHVFSKVSLQQIQTDLHKDNAKQAHTIGVPLEEDRLLKLKNGSLLTRMENMEKDIIASKKAFSDSKSKLRQAIDSEFEYLVSYQTKCMKPYRVLNPLTM